MTAPSTSQAPSSHDGLGAATDRASAIASDAAGAASDVAGTATSAASDVASVAKDQAAQVLSDSVEQAKDLTQQVKQQATDQLSTQSERVTTQLRTLSGQLTSGDTSGLVGQVLTEAGRRLQALTDHVERVGPEGLLRDVRGYARRNPGSFLVGAALAGLVSGRIMKGVSASSSAPAAPQVGSAPQGTATGSPVAGVSQPGLGVAAGYEPTPYPDSSYELPREPSLYAETRNGGSL